MLLQRMVASFIVRVVHEPGNEYMSWSITVQHVQSGRVYRLADLKDVDSLLMEVVKAGIQDGDGRVVRLEPRDF